MFQWLQSLPFWFTVVLFITMCIILIVILIIAVKKGIKISTKNKSISIGNLATTTLTESPHRNCPYNKDIVILLNKVAQITQEKYILQYTELIRIQMDFAEQKIDQARGVFQTVYLKKLEEKKVTDLVSSTSFCAYRKVLFEIQEFILKDIRYFFKLNHIAELTDKEFKIYVDNKQAFFKVKIGDLFNELYFYKQDINSEELYNINRTVIHDVTDCCNELFAMARVFAIETQEKLEAYDNKIQKIISTYI